MVRGVVAMMHLAYDGDARIHENPLRAVQTGIELLITHTTGVRGEKVRSGTYAHVWPRPYLNLAAGEGILESLTSHITLAHMGTHAWAWVCVNMTPKNFGRSRLL